MSDSYKPNVYVLGGKPELDLTFTDLDDVVFTPNLIRLSIKQPDGVIVTVSGDALLTASGTGTLYYYYQPPTVGWYEYEAWGRDGIGREAANTRGFEVVDRVY